MTHQELTLVGLTEDRTALVLVNETGDEFRVPADDKLRAALRGDHARPGQLEIKMESTLRPRDIQARIRAGESPESVADAAGTSIDKIMGYATPVLAERAHIAERAQRASVRRRAVEGSSRVLGDAVAEHLRARNVDPQTVAWDAWRREDGRWALVADVRAPEGPQRAEFVFDAPGRYVVAENDEARTLVGEPVAGGRPAAGRRLSAVGPADEELPLGEDAIGLVREGEERPAEPTRPAASAQPAADEERTVDLTGTARAVRSPEPAPHGDRLADELTGATGDADWMATQASERPARRERPAQQQDPAATPAPAPEPAEPVAAEASEEKPAEEPAPKKPARKSRGRASVPSWDEIMFGGGRSE